MPKIRIEKPTHAEIMKGVAFHADVKPNKDTFLDGNLPGSIRTSYHYMSYKPPVEAGLISPVGDIFQPVVSHMKAGFGMGMIGAKPGNGVPFHNHDTNETFMCMEGRWLLQWQGSEGVGSVEIGRYDLVSFPPHVQRRFEAISADPGKEEALLLAVIAGDSPGTEFAPEVAYALRDMGIKHPALDIQIAGLEAEAKANAA